MGQRYLEDVLSEIDYRPPFAKSTKGKSTATQEALRAEYISQGIQTSVIDAIQNIIRSDRIDYQVCYIDISLFLWPSLNMIMNILVDCFSCKPHCRHREHQEWNINIPSWCQRNQTMH